jgi:hypothetical protein
VSLPQMKSPWGFSQGLLVMVAYYFALHLSNFSSGMIVICLLL